MRDGDAVIGSSGEFAEWLVGFVTAELNSATTELRVRRFATVVFGRCPELTVDPQLEQVVYSLIRSHWTQFLADVPTEPHETHLIQPAAELAAELARRRVPLITLYEMYRVATEATWDFITEIVETLPEGVERSEFLVFFWGRASEWLNGSVGPSVEVYESERIRLQQDSKARRLSLVLDVLGGKALAAGQLSAGLGGYPMSSFHTALVLRCEHHESVGSLEAAALRLGEPIGARNPLVVSPGDQEVWCWYATKSELDVSAFAQCGAWLRERSISVVVGASGPDVSGFTRSHRQAIATRAHVVRARSTAAVTTYEDVELLLLLDKDQDGAEAFVRRTLGPLAEKSVTSQRLRQTVLAFLSLGTADAAAAALSVHKNTVRYRLARVEELTGAPLTSKATELALALRYFETFDPEL